MLKSIDEYIIGPEELAISNADKQSIRDFLWIIDNADGLGPGDCQDVERYIIDQTAAFEINISWPARAEELAARQSRLCRQYFKEEPNDGGTFDGEFTDEANDEYWKNAEEFAKIVHELFTEEQAVEWAIKDSIANGLCDEQEAKERLANLKKRQEWRKNNG